MTVQLAETSLQEWAQMLEQLLGIARTQGYLTYSDILEALPQPEHHVADVDQLYAALQAEGIRVVESPAEITDGAPSEDELLAELPDLTDIATMRAPVLIAKRTNRGPSALRWSNRSTAAMMHASI